MTYEYEGPRMDPVAVTMTMMSFIKHIQSLSDVGHLIDPTASYSTQRTS